MSDFVLVHGAWHGAWCWKRILPALWAGGHRAFAVSLSGVGERAHLGPAGITLDTHIQDVAAVIEAEELQRCILVGHSYAGMVITGAADRLHDRIGQLVYLDAVVPWPGDAWSSRHSPETQAQRRALIAGQGVLPPAPPGLFGLESDDAAWVERRQTAHPGGVYDQPLHYDAERWTRLPRRFIDCTEPALATIAASRLRVRNEPGWTVDEIATGHDAMISAPEALLACLLSAAQDRTKS